jgi:hypothetical protein
MKKNEHVTYLPPFFNLGSISKKRKREVELYYTSTSYTCVFFCKLNTYPLLIFVGAREESQVLHGGLLTPQRHNLIVAGQLNWRKHP